MVRFLDPEIVEKVDKSFMQRDPGEDDVEEGIVKKRHKKTKYAVLKEDWGQEDGPGEPEDEDIDCDSMIDIPCPPPPLDNLSRRLKSLSITDYFPQVSKVPERMSCSRMEDMWMGGEEEDERLDNTLMMLENRGLVLRTPGSNVENMMSNPKSPGDRKRMDQVISFTNINNIP